MIALFSGKLATGIPQWSLPGLTRQSIFFVKSTRRWMDARVKPAYDDLNLPFPSGELIDPRSLSRRKRGQNYRLVRAGIGGVRITPPIRRPRVAVVPHFLSGRGRSSSC